VPDEIGYQAGSLASWTSLAAESYETNPDLMWPHSIDVFDKMRREDSQVGSVLRAVTLPIRSATWQIDPAGASPDVVDLVATDLGLPVKGREVVAPVRTRGRFSWSEHLRLALLELVFGHSFFEQVYRMEGDLARLRKLAWRPPRTIAKIEVAKDGGLKSIQQHGVAGPDVTIPVERLVAYVNEREGGNWLGQSLLRTAYKNWLLKDRMLRAQALTVERNGLGVPVYTGAEAPDTVTGEERQQWLESEKEAGLKLATGFRAGEAAGASIPASAKLELIGVTGKLPDTDAPIRYHDEQIARAVLAHFLNLGTETGSWALGSTFANFFTDSLNAVAGHIADVTQQHVVEDLVDLNWGPDEPAPRLVCEQIGSEQAATAEAIKQLIESKAVTPDDGVETFMRASYGLPVKDPASARAAADESTEEGA
jgi:phage gp29-like protein